MATTATRLTNTGTLLVNGVFDEVTFNTTAGNTAIYNQFANSQVYSGANWVLSSTSITPNVAIAPDGTNTATLLTALNAYPTLTDSVRNNPKFPVTAGDVWTVSGYVKYGNLQYMNIINEYVSGTGWYTGGVSSRYDLINGTVSKGANVTAAGMISVGNNWWRMYSTYTIPTGVTGWNPQIYRMGQYDATNYAGNIVYIWGAQLEKNANVSTYQATTSSNVLLTPSWATRTVPGTVYATGQFDEVTYSTGFAKRETQTGNLYVTGSFDEFTGAPVVDGNLKLWLDAGQVASYPGTGTNWTDLSTNQLNGTLVNTPTFSSNPANILFNGTSQRVTFTSNTAVQFLNTAPYTLEAWVYPTQIPPAQTYQGLIDRENNPGTGRDGWNLWLAGNSQSSTTSVTFGAERFGLGVQSGASISVTAVSTIGVWQHMVATYDRTTIRVYRNGVQVTSAASSVNITNTTQTVGLASRGGAGSFLYGSISAAKIYDRALTADEVAQNFNALRRRYNI